MLLVGSFFLIGDRAMVEFNLFSLFGLSIHFHVHWPRSREEVKELDQMHASGSGLAPKRSTVEIIPRISFRHPTTGALIPIETPPPHPLAAPPKPLPAKHQ